MNDASSSFDDLTAANGLREVLQRLVAGGLGASIGLDAAERGRLGVTRVVRLGKRELQRRLADLYDASHADFLRYATSKLGNRQDAEDVVNEAFIRVLRADPDLVAPDALVGYLRTVVSNESRRRGSSITRHREHRHAGDPHVLEHTVEAPDRPIDERIADEITIGLAMATLPQRERQALTLRLLEDRSEKEAAERMDVSAGAVKRYCADGRQRIAAALAGT